MVGCYLHIRIDGNHLLLGAFHLRGVQVLGPVDDLSLHVSPEVNHIGIHDTDMSHASRSEVEGNWGTQFFGTNDEHLGIEELLLPLKGLHPEGGCGGLYLSIRSSVNSIIL